MNTTIDIQKVRADFPALQTTLSSGKRLVYLDNAATTQKPLTVLDVEREHALHLNANIHRGVHTLSREATEAHEEARKTVADFINAESSDEILFTRGTTESINLVAATFVPSQMKEGDEILITEMEHHSNIVPWQLAIEGRGITLRAVPILDNGELNIDALRSMLTDRTKLISLCYASNVLGTINPIAEVVRIAHAHGIPVLVDAAQAIAHRPIDVQALGADFLAFSAHKVYGPTGMGVLWGKREWLDKLPPYQGGGEMIEKVTLERTTFNALPFKFEAGTPDFLGSVALAEALRYVKSLGFSAIQAHEEELLRYATEKMMEIPGMRIYGTAPHKEAVISFLVDGVHPYDLGTLLDQLGIAIRTGHHCAQPLMHRLGIEGTARVSFALYNTKEEVDTFISALKRVLPMLQ